MRFVLASGRRHQNSVRYYHELGLDTPLISCAGALIKDPHTGRTLREALLPAPLAAEIAAEGQARDFSVIYYHRDHLFVSRRDHWIDLYETRVQERAELCDLATLHGDAALKIVWYGEPDTVRGLRAQLQERYADRASIVMTDPENLEFSAPSANKAAALAAVAEFYRVELAATLAFGDGENDIPMLSSAGLGIAMDHGAAREHCPGAAVAPAGAPEESFARAARRLLEAPGR